MTIRLCVLLWPHEARDADLRRYEDAVLPFLADHGGTLIARETVNRTSGEQPLEVQVIEFTNEDELDRFMKDPRRLALETQRKNVVRRTEILRLSTSSTSPAG